MKPYFAKYLPVEGEIKEGDYFYSPATKEILFASKDMLSWNSDTTQEHKGWKKVKLFLCSRNIKVGDKVEFQLVPNKTKWKNGVVKWSEEDTAEIDLGEMTVITTPDSYCFKVIGEISKDAIWVKEGMEFDKDEIYLKYDVAATSRISKALESEGYILENEQPAWDNEGRIYDYRRLNHIEIKCPTCKTFH